MVMAKRIPRKEQTRREFPDSTKNRKTPLTEHFKR